MKSRSSEALRNDIPLELRMQAASIDPSLLAWLEAAYPTDAEHARELRRRTRQQAQLPLPHTDRSAA